LDLKLKVVFAAMSLAIWRLPVYNAACCFVRQQSYV